MRPAGDLDIHMSPPVLSSTGYTNNSAAAAAPPPTQICDVHTCPWWPYSNSKDFKTNTALILIILFCALLCALAFNAVIRYILRHQHRQQRASNDQQDVEATHEKSSMAAEVEMEVVVPTLIYSDGMKLTECTICLSEFVDGDVIRVLDSCEHGFHLQCIQKWLIYHSSCPTCRATCFPRPLIVGSTSERPVL